MQHVPKKLNYLKCPAIELLCNI